MMAAREAYAQAFSDLNVDVVLSGHDHVYCRSLLMQGEMATGRADGDKRSGETLYVSGGTPSGSKFYELKDNLAAYLAYRILKQEATVSLITISGNQLVLETYAVDSRELIDRCELNK